MKKYFLIPAITLLLGACAENSENQEPTPGNNDGVIKSYLSVSIYSPGSSTRVDGYVNGEDEENQINTVRFFFFTESNTACDVFKQTQSGNYLSYIDWTPYDSDIKPGDPDFTVSKIAQATLGINQPAGAVPPAKVIAVINPTSDILALVNPSLSDLTDQIDDYYTGLHDGNFLMTNSVYSDMLDNKEIKITATPISEENLAENEDDFTKENTPKKALNIFVERVLARVDFSLTLSEENNPKKEIGEGTNKYYIYKVSDPTVNGDTKEVYVKLLGWNITATATESRLIKEINPTWTTNLFGGGNPWNSADFHRSFWAVNPPDVEFNYGSFNSDSTEEEGDINPALRNPIPTNNDPTAYETVYVQENAADYSEGENGLQADGPNNPTKIIIGAQLVDDTGKPLPLARWANRYYLQDDLLTAVANVLNLYQETTVDGMPAVAPITPDYLEFVSPENVDLPEGEIPASYYTYVQLNKEGEGITWYDGPSATNRLSKEQANAYILNRVNYVMVWESGLTYYYFDIKHFGNSVGAVGIVRNHLYKANLKSIKGLGTPVFDPDLVIKPEIPEYDDNVLRVDINVLQWRVVPEDYEITWP